MTPLSEAVAMKAEESLHPADIHRFGIGGVMPEAAGSTDLIEQFHADTMTRKHRRVNIATAAFDVAVCETSYVLTKPTFRRYSPNRRLR
jgi:hypothetical protein